VPLWRLAARVSGLASGLALAVNTGWGEPIYLNTAKSLMAMLTHAHNEPDQGPPPRDQLPPARYPASSIAGVAGVRIGIVASKYDVSRWHGHDSGFGDRGGIAGGHFLGDDGVDDGS
jgi:hypothetical protein